MLFLRLRPPVIGPSLIFGWRVCDWERKGGEGVAPLREPEVERVRPKSGEEEVEEMEA
jgi:hypothetical protein